MHVIRDSGSLMIQTALGPGIPTTEEGKSEPRGETSTSSMSSLFLNNAGQLLLQLHLIIGHGLPDLERGPGSR